MAEEPVERLPKMTIEAEPERPFNEATIDPDKVPPTAPDAAQLLIRAPGANFNFNGKLTGQAQYRGMFGPRINVRLNGISMEPGGPNWMDPPLHYMPPALMESITVTRGIAPVSSGMGIGGYVEAKSKTSRFTDSEQFEFHGSAQGEGHTVDGGGGGGGLVYLANHRHRLHAVGSREEGDDTRFPEGIVKATQYERSTFGGGYGFKIGDHDVGLDYRRTETDDSGTPALPMDIGFVDTDRFSGEYNGFFGVIKLESKLFYSRVEHQMNNFTLRDAPNFFEPPSPPPFFQGSDRRLVNANSDDVGYVFKASIPLAGGALTAGSDGSFAEHDAKVLDPDFAPFFVKNFNNAQQDNFGAFVEWKGAIAPRWTVEAGARYNRSAMDAGKIDAFPAQLADRMIAAGAMPMGPPAAVRALRERFNDADRSQDEDNLDAVLTLDYQLLANTRLALGFARKERNPSYIERYLWIPLEVNAGLGDGNNYVGKVDLDPEVSYQFELGLDWRTDRFNFAPRAFYRRVDDYIQGVPVPATPENAPIIAISTTNGDPTPLQFANVDAEFWGVDAEFGVALADHWRADAVGTFVRGRRRDIEDDLYRITPPNLRLSLTHQRPTWFATVETVLVDRQDKISRTNTFDPQNPNNSFRETPGYVLLNLYGQWRPFKGLSLTAGVDNLLDKNYTDHLSGFNRVLGSDVPVGRRLPGPGINGYLQVAYSW